MTGVLLAVPPADFVLHNSLFLVAHFHNVIIGGVLFGLFAAIKLLVAQGLRLPAGRLLGQDQLLAVGRGLWFAFMPLYILGLMGVTRRMRVFDDPDLWIWFAISGLGVAMVAGGIGAMLMQFGVSIWRRKEWWTKAAIPGTGARWNGRPRRPRRPTTSPSRRSFTAGRWNDMKQVGQTRPQGTYLPIHMPATPARA